jgi:hypothetical protein
MSFRNRCTIAGANGPINLSVPILGGRNIRVYTSEVLIDNRQSWQMTHWKSICSCYNHAPWFDEYKYSCEEIFSTPFDRLVDLNRSALNWIITQLNWDLTSEDGPLPDNPGQFSNYINKFKPNKMMQFPVTVEYHQVFEERTGFQPHLSILDFLFCIGPRAGEILRKSQRSF